MTRIEMSASYSIRTPPLTQHDDEREALAKILWIHDVSNHAASAAPEIGRLCDSAADAILAAGFHRTPTITDEMVRKALMAMLDWWTSEYPGFDAPIEGSENDWSDAVRAALEAALTTREGNA